jgi:hypothetical protein
LRTESPREQSPQINVPTPVSTPTIANQSATQLLSSPALFADFDPIEQTLYYLDPNDNSFKKLDVVTRKITTIGTSSGYVERVAWSPDHTQLLLRMSNEQGNRVTNPLYQNDSAYGEIIVGLYTLSTKRLTRLNSNILTFSFIGNDKIIYQYQDEKYNNLSLSRPDGTRWKNIGTFNVEVEILSAGNSVLVRELNSPLVTRYGPEGKVTESFSVPAELALAQSDWPEQGMNALYWIHDDEAGDNEVLVQRLSPDKVETAARLTKTSDILSILWDNKTNVFYLITFSGIEKHSF